MAQQFFQCNGCDKWYKLSERALWNEDFATCNRCESMEPELLVQRSIVKLEEAERILKAQGREPARLAAMRRTELGYPKLEESAEKPRRKFSFEES